MNGDSLTELAVAALADGDGGFERGAVYTLFSSTIERITAINGSAVFAGTPVALASGALATLHPDGQISYDPNGQFEGLGAGETATDQFTYTLTDAAGHSGTATVTVRIEGRNDDPVAADDSLETIRDQAISVTADALLENDSDAEGSELSIVAVSDPANGQAILRTSGAITYTPNPGFFGVDTFSYTIADAQGGLATATVSIAVDAAIVINEIDYAQPTGALGDFIELYNSGATPLDLNAFSLVLVDGATGALYDRINLPNVELAAGGYFVVSADAAIVTNTDLEIPGLGLQDGSGGGDAVALMGDGLLIDTVSYEADVAGFVEKAAVIPGDDDALVRHGIARVPTAIDTNDNSLDFILQCITPGASNTVHNGDVVIDGRTSQAFLDTLAHICGNVLIQGTVDLTNVLLSNLTTIDGELVVTDNPVLNDLNLPQLAQVFGDVIIDNNPRLSATDVGSLTDIGGTVTLGDAPLDIEQLVRAGDEVNVEDGGVLAVGGKLTTDKVTIKPGGEAKGDGEIEAEVENNGSVKPGKSPERLTITGDFTQGADGVLVLEIGGPLSALEHDVLAVNGDAIIAGTVIIDFIDGFAPSVGQMFNVFEVTGTLDLSAANFVVQNAPPGVTVDPAAADGAVTIVSDCDDHGLLSDPDRVPGNVRVRVWGRDLRIDGDKHANAIRVYAAPNGDVLVEGLGGTTVNGQTAAFVAFAGVGGVVPDDVRINLGRGDDFVCLANLSIADDLDIDTGRGIDVVSLAGVAVGDDLKIDTGKGGDFVDLTGVTIGDDALFFSGSGDDALVLHATQFGDDLSLWTDGGDDSILMDGVTVGDRTSIASGAGDDVVQLVDSTFGSTLGVDLGTGDDALQILNSRVEGWLRVLPLWGDNVVDLDSSHFQDRVDIETLLGHLALRIRGNVFDDRADFRGGIFRDDVFLDDGSNEFGGRMRIRGFNDFSNELIDAVFEELGGSVFA